MALPNPVVEGNVLAVPTIQSVDWRNDVSNQVGWQINRDGTASFNNVNLFGGLGASALSADTVTVNQVLALPNYVDVGATLDSVAGALKDTKGQLVGWWDQTDANLTGITTEIKTVGLDLKCHPNRFYLIQILARITTTSGTAVNPVATGQMLLRGIANTDGSFPAVPTTANTATMLQVTFMGVGGTGTVTQGAALTPTGICILDTTGWAQDTWVRMILTLSRTDSASTIAQASGTASLGTPTLIRTVRYAPASRIVVMDFGDSGSMNFEAKGYNTTDTPPATPTTAPAAKKTYTKTYNSTWSRTYDGNNNTTWDDSAYCYSGYYSNTRGNTRSLIGFDYATIAADLAGATLVSAYLYIKGAHAYYNNGFTCWWGTHNYTAKPATWNGANVNAQRNFITGLAAGTSAKINIGTGIEAEFASQVSRGIAIGPGPTTSFIYYGFVYGATQSGKPYLVLTYTK